VRCFSSSPRASARAAPFCMLATRSTGVGTPRFEGSAARPKWFEDENSWTFCGAAALWEVLFFVRRN
jgi:hypothetical protein